MTDKSKVSFFPRHREYTTEQHDEAIAKYREWLDTHGRYGKLYMMEIGKVPKDMLPDGSENTPNIQSQMIGINIYDPEIALLFRIMFNL
jgi:hypothetical protein